jgi:putative membrane protein
MGWMTVWWILIPALIAALAWALIKGARGPSASSESPEEILRRRYARGELDDETFRRMRDELRKP